MTVIAFKKVRDAYGWMSNMSPHPVNDFRTAEALFQAMRFEDQKIIELIRAEKSPMGAKMRSKANADKWVIVPRSDRDLLHMRLVLEAKIVAHPDLKEQLLNTAERLIVEDVTNRPNESGLFWGAAFQGDGTWVGENTLGKLWMELRAHIRYRERQGPPCTRTECYCGPETK